MKYLMEQILNAQDVTEINELFNFFSKLKSLFGNVKKTALSKVRGKEIEVKKDDGTTDGRKFLHWSAYSFSAFFCSLLKTFVKDFFFMSVELQGEKGNWEEIQTAENAGKFSQLSKIVIGSDEMNACLFELKCEVPTFDRFACNFSIRFKADDRLEKEVASFKNLDLDLGDDNLEQQVKQEFLENPLATVHSYAFECPFEIDKAEENVVKLSDGSEVVEENALFLAMQSGIEFIMTTLRKKGCFDAFDEVANFLVEFSKIDSLMDEIEQQNQQDDSGLSDEEVASLFSDFVAGLS